jgi:hypothetical protein
MANPGKISFASPGVGSSIHMSGELFKAMAKIDMLQRSRLAAILPARRRALGSVALCAPHRRLNRREPPPSLRSSKQ